MKISVKENKNGDIEIKFDTNAGTEIYTCHITACGETEILDEVSDQATEDLLYLLVEKFL